MISLSLGHQEMSRIIETKMNETQDSSLISIQW
jgi:hypothetical protein